MKKIILFIPLFTLLFLGVYALFIGYRYGLLPKQSPEGDWYEVLEMALDLNDESICNSAKEYYADQGDYGYTVSKSESIETCRGSFYGIMGDVDYCNSLKAGKEKNRCNYYIRQYPTNFETCKNYQYKFSGSFTPADVGKYCEQWVGACPVNKNSNYCKKNNLK